MDDCPNCRRFAEENERLTNEISGMLTFQRKQAASLAALERELRRTRSEDPEAGDIRFVLSEWRALTGHPRAQVDESSDRWPLVKKQLKRRDLQQVMWTVHGMALAPHMHYGRFRVDPCGRAGCCQRKNDIKDVFANDARFEELMDVGRRAEQAPSQKLFEALERISAQDRLIARRVLDALARESADRLLGTSLPAEEYERRFTRAAVVDIRTKKDAA